MHQLPRRPAPPRQRPVVVYGLEARAYGSEQPPAPDPGPWTPQDTSPPAPPDNPRIPGPSGLPALGRARRSRPVSEPLGPDARPCLGSPDPSLGPLKRVPSRSGRQGEGAAKRSATTRSRASACLGRPRRGARLEERIAPAPPSTRRAAPTSTPQPRESPKWEAGRPVGRPARAPRGACSVWRRARRRGRIAEGGGSKTPRRPDRSRTGAPGSLTLPSVPR